MINIRNYNGTLDDLIFAVGNMHYDVTAAVLNKIADSITKKAYDTNSSNLRDIANCVYEAKEHINTAWTKCKGKMDCSKHPRTVIGFSGTFDELGYDISNSSYKDLVFFLDKMGDDLLRQADADWKRSGAEERKKLAAQLYNAANNLYKVRFEV